MIRNLKPESDLANGTTSFAMDTVWEETVIDKNISDATALSDCIDFRSDYKGKSFFPNILEGWGLFPIFSYQLPIMKLVVVVVVVVVVKKVIKLFQELWFLWNWLGLGLFTRHKSKQLEKAFLELGDH